MRGPGGGDAEEHRNLGGDAAQVNGVGCLLPLRLPSSTTDMLVFLSSLLVPALACIFAMDIVV
jgi:hypothetical protein